MQSAEVFVTLVERQIRLRAKRAWLGVAWPVVAPLLLLALYAFVFNRIFTVPIDHYGEFLFAGLLPWTLVAQGLGLTVSSISSEPELIRRSRFPYEFLPMAGVAAMAAYFFVTLVGFVVYLAIVGRLDLVYVALLVVPVAALVLFTMSIAALLALLDVYNRDLRAVLGNILTVWFFLIPIVYRQDMVSSEVQTLRSIDPMNMIVGQFRDLLIYHQVSRPGHLVLMAVVCTALFVGTRRTFAHWNPRLPRDV